MRDRWRNRIFFGKLVCNKSMKKIIYPPVSVDRQPILVHVPHSSMYVPEWYREHLILDDGALNAELVKMTDLFTEDLFEQASSYGATVFVNKISRLVMDPERFPNDEDEPMSAKGMGAIYTKTSTGEMLRAESFTLDDRQHIMRELYWPYTDAFRNLVMEQLDQFGKCLIIDGHSFPSKPLPYEAQKLLRPDFCFGYEPFHEPKGLIENLEEVSKINGFTSARNQPFSGAYVPTDFYQTSKKVKSIMVEINRSLYLDETTGKKSPGYEELNRMLDKIIAIACSYQITTEI